MTEFASKKVCLEGLRRSVNPYHSLLKSLSELVSLKPADKECRIIWENVSNDDPSSDAYNPHGSVGRFVLISADAKTNEESFCGIAHSTANKFCFQLASSIGVLGDDFEESR